MKNKPKFILIKFDFIEVLRVLYEGIKLKKWEDK